MSEKKLTQIEQVMRLLEEYPTRGISQCDALWMVKPMCTRLAVCIHRLRKRGWVIDTVLRESFSEPGTHYAVYILRKKGN